jgi:hypothetical protein
MVLSVAKSTGPMLAVGAITFGNGWILNHQSPNFRILLGTTVAAGGLALFEHVSEPLAVGIAWIALVTVLVTRINNKPSPAENLLKVTKL